jgi:L-aminopeptidase/D-esterase-like protein
MKLHGISVGHYSNFLAETGVTVFILDKPAKCAFYLCGSAPATRDTLLLEPGNFVDSINGLVFTGGSAFGLGASNGVMQYLVEQGIGFATDGGLVPIVPVAGIYDLTIGKATFPKPEDGYNACQQASKDNVATGKVGAATGASIGKLYPNAKPANGGFGICRLEIQGEIGVTACVVVNAVGDIVSDKGDIIAGATDDKGNFLNTQRNLLQGKAGNAAVQQNTTLVELFIEASCDQLQLRRIAKMASAGIAKAISPSFTSYDGDIVYAVSMGDTVCDEVVLGALAAEATRQAILGAVA